MANLLVLLLTIFAVMGIGHAYAQTSELFVPLPDSELESLDAFEGYNFESKMVTIDTQIFSSERISITIFGQSTTFTKDSVEHYDDGNYLWIGSNDDQETAMFEISGTKAVGVIDTLNKTFQVFPVEDTTHEVYLIDHSQFPPDTVVPPGASGEQSFDRDEIDHLVESYIGGFKYDRFTEELVIDVFIAITTDALTEYGDFERFISNLVIRNTDSTYGYNDIPVELNLVDRDIVEGYTETNKLSKDLRKFQTSDEGNLERIRVLIEEEQADIAIMFVAGDGDKRKEGDLDNKCSLTAQQLVRSPSTAFAVVDIKCLAAHSATNAIGRMHGAGYDIDMERNPIFSHGHGYYDAGIASRTMMASSGGNCNNPITQAEETCRRDRAWSDPFRNFFGTTNRAGDDVSWNARVIFATAPHIASLRGPAQAYEDTRPTGFVTLPQNIPRSGSLDISATFNEIISPNFPLDVTITDGYTSTTGTMTRTSDTTFEYSHLLDGEDGTFSILFSNARDIFGNPVVRTPTSGGTVTLDANNIPQSPISGPFTTNFKDNFQGGLSQWKLTGYGRPTTATPDEVIFPATDTNTANKVMSSNQCSRICMSTIPTLLDTRQPLTISFDRFVDKSIRQDDGLYLEYSVDDGATWTTLAEYTSDNDEDTDDWEREYLSLAIPQSSAKLRLLMDVSERRGFVEVDNFKVYKPTPAEPDIILKPHLGAERTSISFSLMERIPFRLDASDFEISHGTIISLSHRANSAAVTMRVADIPYDTQITVTYTGPSILINRAYLNSGTSGVTNIISTPATMPEITAPSDKTIEATGILTRLTAEQLGTPEVTGNRLLPVTNNAPRDFPLGDTTVRWTVTDASRNFATDTQVITIRDTTPPVIQKPANILVEAASSFTAIRLTNPAISDIFPVAITNNAPDRFPIGTTTVTWIATDTSGNSVSMTQDVTIRDTMPPQLGTIRDMTFEATGVLTPLNSADYGIPSATDLSDVTITNNAPASFPLGNTIITWTATDESGNTSTITSTITIEDTTPPTIAQPAPITVDATAVLTPVSISAPAATDIVDSDVVVVTTSNTASFAVGTHNIVWTATDDSGNTATLTQTVTVRDRNPPTFTHTPSDILLVSPDMQGRTAMFDLPTATDAEDPNVTVTCIPSPSSSRIFPVGSTTVSCTARDSSGNTATISFSVIISRAADSPPSITAPASKIIITTDQSVVLPPQELGTPIVQDDMDSNPVIANNAPAAFSPGITKVVWVATDSYGNNATANQWIVIHDNVSPGLTLSAAVTIDTTQQITPFNTGDTRIAQYHDNQLLVNRSSPPIFLDNYLLELGANIVEWTTIDPSGNIAQLNQNVTVQNSTAVTANQIFHDTFDDSLDSWIQRHYVPHEIQDEQCDPAPTSLYGARYSEQYGGSAQIYREHDCGVSASIMYKTVDIADKFDNHNFRMVTEHIHILDDPQSHILYVAIVSNTGQVLGTAKLVTHDSIDIRGNHWQTTIVQSNGFDVDRCPCVIQLYRFDRGDQVLPLYTHIDNVHLAMTKPASSGASGDSEIPADKPTNVLTVAELEKFIAESLYYDRIIISAKYVQDDDSNNNSIGIGWDDIDDSYTHDYTVSAWPVSNPDDITTHSVLASDNNNNLQHMFAGLEPDTQYMVTVQVTGDDSTRTGITISTSQANAEDGGANTS